MGPEAERTASRGGDGPGPALPHPANSRVPYGAGRRPLARTAGLGGALHLLTTQATEVRNDLTVFGMIERLPGGQEVEGP